jgi:hypothetical protein
LTSRNRLQRQLRLVSATVCLSSFKSRHQTQPLTVPGLMTVAFPRLEGRSSSHRISGCGRKLRSHSVAPSTVFPNQVATATTVVPVSTLSVCAPMSSPRLGHAPHASPSTKLRGLIPIRMEPVLPHTEQVDTAGAAVPPARRCFEPAVAVPTQHRRGEAGAHPASRICWLMVTYLPRCGEVCAIPICTGCVRCRRIV